MTTPAPDAPKDGDPAGTPPPATGGTPPPATGGPAGDPPAEPAEAELAKWKALARKHEAESNANKAKAKQFDALEESQKTELQKAADRALAAETALAEVTARALRAEIASAKQLPASALPLLTGTTKEEIEASADALLAFRGKAPLPDTGGGDNRGGDVNGKNNFESQIAEAQKLGQFQKVIALKQAQHHESLKP